jgi:hypothetical protein
VARAGGTISSGGSPVEDWRGGVSEERLLRAGRILAAFGMDRIYRADDPMPLVRADDVLGAFNTG